MQSALLLCLLSIASPQIAGASTSLQTSGYWNVEANWTSGVPNGNYAYVTSGLEVTVPAGVTGYTDAFFVGDAFAGAGSVLVDGGALHTSFPRIGHIWVDSSTGLLQAAASGNLRIIGSEFSYGSLDFFIGTLSIEGGVVTGGGDHTNIGVGKYSHVTVNVTSVPGFGSQWTTAKYLQIGNDSATGRINISGADTHLTSQSVSIANDNFCAAAEGHAGENWVPALRRFLGICGIPSICGHQAQAPSRLNTAAGEVDFLSLRLSERANLVTKPVFLWPSLSNDRSSILPNRCTCRRSWPGWRSRSGTS